MAIGGTIPPAMTAAMMPYSPETSMPVPTTYAALFTGPPMSTAIMPPMRMPIKMRLDVSMPFKVSIIQLLMPATGGLITKIMMTPTRKMPRSG